MFRGLLRRFQLNKKKGTELCTKNNHLMTDAIYNDLYLSHNININVGYLKKKQLSLLSPLKGPVGLDIGTSHIIVSFQNSDQIMTNIELNAFYKMRLSQIVYKKWILNNFPNFTTKRFCYILGYASHPFAHILHSSLRRPITGGFISPNEIESIQAIQAILEYILPKPQKQSELLYFSVPAAPFEDSSHLVYHTEVIKRFIHQIGYHPVPINEGLAVILSELHDEGYTGIGISFGGGMCNACLSYLSVPVITLCIQKGGDYIDQKAGESVGVKKDTMKLIKEQELDLSLPPANRFQTALHIFYDDMITSMITSLKDELCKSDRIPTIKNPIPIVLSGGSIIPKGFLEKFTLILDQYQLPIAISKIIVAKKPLESTAIGALIAAITE